MIGNVEVLLAKTALAAEHRLGAAGHIGLDLAVFEHRFDDKLGTGEPCVVGSRRHPRDDRARLGLSGAPALDRGLLLAADMVKTAACGLLADIEQCDIDAGAGGDMGDPRAHQPGAEHADPREALARHCGRPARQFVGLLQIDELSAHHVAGARIAHQLDKGLGFDPQPGVDRHQHTAINDRLDGVECRVVAVSLCSLHRVCR